MIEDLIRMCEGLTKSIKIEFNGIINGYEIIAYDYLGNKFL